MTEDYEEPRSVEQKEVMSIQMTALLFTKVKKLRLNMNHVHSELKQGEATDDASPLTKDASAISSGLINHPEVSTVLIEKIEKANRIRHSSRQRLNQKKFVSNDGSLVSHVARGNREKTLTGAKLVKKSLVTVPSQDKRELKRRVGNELHKITERNVSVCKIGSRKVRDV